MFAFVTKNGIFRLSRLTKFIDDTAIIKYWVNTNRFINYAIFVNTAFY